jgi:hypothetical protein
MGELLRSRKLLLRVKALTPALSQVWEREQRKIRSWGLPKWRTFSRQETPLLALAHLLPNLGEGAGG